MFVLQVFIIILVILIFMIPQKFAIANSLFSAVVFSKDVFILSDCFANLSISQNVSCHMCD